MDIDVKKVMLKLLETQKEYVLADLEKYSEAMVAVFTADGKPYVEFPKFQDEAGKNRRIYRDCGNSKVEERDFDDHGK
jgi:hypothetical protein